MEDDLKFSLGIKHQIFNNEVRKRRSQMALTQSQLGQMCGFSKATISQIETFRQYPTLKQAEKLAEVLNSSIEVLFPKWIQEMRGKNTTMVTEHFVTERILQHPELKMLPAEEGNVEEIENNIDRELLIKKIDKVLDTLSEREVNVLELRFGLHGKEPHTYDETAEELTKVGFGRRTSFFREGKFYQKGGAVTRERIRQVEAKALRKLKHPSRRNKLKDFLTNASPQYSLVCPKGHITKIYVKDYMSNKTYTCETWIKEEFNYKECSLEAIKQI